MLLNQNQLARELHLLSRVRVFVAGKPADDHDVRQFWSVTVLRYGLELDLSGYDTLSKCTHRRNVLNVDTLDLRKYAEDFKELKIQFLSSVNGDPRCHTWPCFKRRVAGKLHYRWMLTTMANLFDDAAAALQWVTFDERLLLTTNADDIGDEIQEYLDHEAGLGTIVYPQATTEALRSIIAHWFQDFCLASGPVQCKFGPGAVSEWSGRQPELRKAQRMVYDRSIVEEFAAIFAVDPDTLTPGTPGPACVTNRIIFRPKNALKHRIISAEPCWLTWLQQGIKNPVYAYINRHREMFTDFSDQSQSRALALAGSADGSYATVDFSNASDSVTVELVTDLFRDTDLLWPLLASRSQIAEMPDGRTCELRKFAPMGSATCFFTMDVILLSVCEQAVRLTLGRKGRRGDYVVYGDDVIIRSDCYPAFAEISSQLHFKMNADKSYFGVGGPHFYRESCGIEALDGKDITPLRYSRFQEPVVERINPSSQQYVTSIVDLSNRLLRDYLYWNTRSVLWTLIKWSIDRAGNHAREVWDHVKRVDVTDADHSDVSPLAMLVPDGTATNYRTKRRWNADLQRAEILCTQWLADPRTLRDRDHDMLLWLWCSHVESLQQSPTPDIIRESPVRAAGGLGDPKWSLGWYGQ